MKKRILIKGIFILVCVLALGNQTWANDSICQDAGLTGKGLGLCTAYCEAMQCDDDNPIANIAACEEVKSEFFSTTGLPMPCGDGTGEPPLPDIGCPCDFDSQGLRDLFTDESSYPYQTCIREHYTDYEGSEEGVYLYFADHERYWEGNYLGLISRIADAPENFGNFDCAAGKVEENAWHDSPRPFGYVSLEHNYLGERLPVQDAIYRACESELETIINEFGLTCIEDKRFAVQVTAEPSTGYCPLTVQFEIDDSLGEPPFSDYLWDFGDGNSSTDPNPSYTYTYAGGWYDVSVTFLDANGAEGRGETKVLVDGYCESNQ